MILKTRDSGYHVERTDDIASLLADPLGWDQLSAGVPLRETAWLGTWWKIYGQEREAYVVTVRNPQGLLCGLLPMYRLKNRVRDGRTLYAMGDGSTCTDHFSVLAPPHSAVAISTEIGHWLSRVSRDHRDGWDLMDLDGVVGGDRSMAAMCEALRDQKSIVHPSSRMNIWFRSTREGWDAVLSQLAKKDRQKLKRHRAMLESGGELRCRTASTSEEVCEALDVLIELHQRRWTAVGEAGSFASPRCREFLHATAQEFFDRDQLRLTWVEFAERPICSEFRIIGRDRVMYCYSTGMDKLYAHLEPGRVLHAQGLLYTLEHGLSGINYMRGDETYKQRLFATPRPLLRLRVAAPALIPRLRHTAWATSFGIKQFIRQRTSRTTVRTDNLM